jgi:hypothetical protein
VTLFDAKWIKASPQGLAIDVARKLRARREKRSA